MIGAGEGWPHGKPEWAGGYVIGRRLDGEQWLVVSRLTFGRARLAVATADNACVEAY